MTRTDAVFFTVPATLFMIPTPAHETTQRARAGLPRRAAARLFAQSLDRQLTASSPPRAGALLNAHAARLTSSRERERLATWVDMLLSRALTPDRSSVTIGFIRPNYAPIADAQESMRRIIALLTDTSRPIGPRGVARLRRLLCDATGPLYWTGRGSAMEELHLIIGEMRPAEIRSGKS